jgi:hypothetical protein
MQVLLQNMQTLRIYAEYSSQKYRVRFGERDYDIYKFELLQLI